MNIELDTGDLLLFQGNTSFSYKNYAWHVLSYFIERGTHSKFSHCGIVLRDPILDEKKLSGLFLLESTALENVTDVEDKTIKFGVQIRELKEVIDDYDGKIYWRKLNILRDDLFYDRLRQAHSVVHDKPYDDGFDYIKALFNLHIGNIQKNTTFFCSALCAYLYVCWKILPDTTPWSIITPAQLSDGKQQLAELSKFLEVEVQIK